MAESEGILAKVKQCGDNQPKVERKEGYFRRHKILTFISMPVVAYIFIWALAILTTVATAELIESLGHATDTEPFLSAVFMAYSFINCCSTLVVAAVFCVLVYKWAIETRWAVASSATMAIIGLFTYAKLTIAEGAGKSSFYVGAGFSAESLDLITLSSVDGLRLYLPILVLMIFYYYRVRSTGKRD